ncbi:hypothetical protein Tsubulata_002705 [Turnera subulata]|uniref:GRAM domain-containing protein n=1 Tax=Turnera subulata TaxID=218843 RepID=A0A9Q0JNQ8_9ROSI|nr:hypothetical protein Tsubulata_002705 [Turnera subulata]
MKKSIDLPAMDPSASGSSSDVAPESPALFPTSDAADAPDRHQPSSSAPSPSRDPETPSPAALRSEEYRQLFRLPPDEVLVQDFNCAFQESILLQGHMYLFVNYICFYSNIFGFETKKVIPFNEVASVKRAKTAGIFPNAIEILAGGKKYFFASFLSRDEAFKLINDGWLQRDGGAKAISDQKESTSEPSCQGGLIVIEKESISGSNGQENGLILIEEVNSFKEFGDLNSNMRLSPSLPQKQLHGHKITSNKLLNQVALPDQLLQQNCGHGVCRISMHPKMMPLVLLNLSTKDVVIKVQNLAPARRSRNFEHLVVETSQEINDVPYGDYFRVEGLWEAVRDGEQSNEGCILRIYVDVAHELLKQKNLEKQEENVSVIQSGEVDSERGVTAEELLSSSDKSSDHGSRLHVSGSEEANQQGIHLSQVNFMNATSVTSMVGEYVAKFISVLRSQSQITLILVVAFAVIFLMQVSILVLLKRPQNVHLASPEYYSGGIGVGRLGERSEAVAWLDRRTHHLRDEMLMVEAQLERLRHEYAWLKARLKDLEKH